MNNPVKAVLFDIDNTLLDFGECAKDAIIHACLKSGINYEPRMFAAFMPVNDILWRQVEDGFITVERLHEIRFNVIFSALDLPYDGKDFEKLFRLYVKKAAAPVKGAVDVLEYLKDKYFLAVASNSSLSQQYARLEKAGMAKYFDAFFVSDEVGANKPSAEFFSKCLLSLPTKNKDEIMLIGDSLSADIEGGIKFGIKTCWFNFKGEKTSLSPDYIINDLSLLKNIL